MKFKDLTRQYECLRPAIDQGIREVLDNGSFILGKPVQVLETQLAAFTGRKHCIVCGSGTDALQLALMAWDIGKGDAVFTSDFSYAAATAVTCLLGAVPVFVDIDPTTFNMDPADLEKQIVRTLREGCLKPAVIIPVDLFGLPADYDRIMTIADQYGLQVLEDGAQGLGGAIKGRKACSFGQASVTSFFPAKPLGCYGDGGAVFTDDAEMAKRLKSLRCLGRSERDKYENREIGINSRLDTLQAAILLPKLQAFREFELSAINKVASCYSQHLDGYVQIPAVPDGSFSSWAQYTILLKDGQERSRIQEALAKEDIPSMIYYPRGLHLQPAFSNLVSKEQRFDQTQDVASRCLSLPIHPYLSKEEMMLVCRTIIQALDTRTKERVDTDET